jgi:hypothetical protein
MSGKRHPWGCTCKTHVARPWRRSEHWTAAEVELLDQRYGRMSDAAIGKRLGRTELAVHLKAKRLGLHKRDAGMTARSVAEIFGMDASTVCKAWLRPGLMRGRPNGRRDVDGRVVNWIVDAEAVERFIADHPEWIDIEKMPDSYYRDLAARDPWVSLREVHRLTGRNHHAVARLALAGEIRGRRRGTHWYVPLADVARIRPLASEAAISESVFRRESVLAVRRNRRKGVAARRAA